MRVDSRAYLKTSASCSVTRSALTGSEWIRFARTLRVLNKKCGLIALATPASGRAQSIRAFGADSPADGVPPVEARQYAQFVIACSCTVVRQFGGLKTTTDSNR